MSSTIAGKYACTLSFVNTDTRRLLSVSVATQASVCFVTSCSIMPPLPWKIWCAAHGDSTSPFWLHGKVEHSVYSRHLTANTHQTYISSCCSAVKVLIIVTHHSFRMQKLLPICLRQAVPPLLLVWQEFAISLYIPKRWNKNDSTAYTLYVWSHGLLGSDWECCCGIQLLLGFCAPHFAFALMLVPLRDNRECDALPLSRAKLVCACALITAS